MTVMTPAHEEIRHFLQAARPRKVRSIREFAEQDIVIPDGDFRGKAFRCSRAPWSRIWFDAIDSGRWNTYVGFGPTQSGKSLTCYVIPVLYHVFEMNENVIGGLPDMRMAQVKWRINFLPVIQASRFRSLLPQSGGGSRGGNSGVFYFLNGAMLLFLTGGGDDKSRASYTARVISVTETDGLDEVGKTSRETDKLSQIIARSDFYDKRRRIYLECTVSLDTGRTWREYVAGTQTRVALPCEHCEQYVTLERENLVGWQDADSELEAEEKSHFVCPACGAAWTEEWRRQANQECRGVALGQEVDRATGRVVGDPPPTRTFAFRWNAANNLFTTTASIAAREWRALRARDIDTSDKEIRQYVWAIPVKAEAAEMSKVDPLAVMRRQADTGQGEVPPEAGLLTVGVDVGKRLLHFVVIAWAAGATGTVIDYGPIDVPSDYMDESLAILNALRTLRDRCLEGWGGVIPHEVWIDAGYSTDTIYTFVRESSPIEQATADGAPVFRACLGRGSTQQFAVSYHQPKSTSATVKYIGDGYHIARFIKHRVHVAEMNSDHWKSWVHARLGTPTSEPGCLRVFRVDKPLRHMQFSHHLAAEHYEEKFEAGRGLVRRWFKDKPGNHFLDACSMGCACAHYCGARLLEGAAGGGLVGLPPAPRPVRRRPEDHAGAANTPHIVEGWMSARRRRR